MQTQNNGNSQIPLLSIDDYAQIIDTDIFELLGLENMPEDKKADIAEKIGETVISRVLANVLESLEGDKAAELKFLLEENNIEAIKQFLNENNIDLKEIVVKEAVVLKAQIATFMTQS